MNEALGLLVFFGAGLSLLLSAVGLARRSGFLESSLYGLIGLLLGEFFLTHAAGFTADMATHPLQTELFLLVRCGKYSLGPLFLVFYLRLTTYYTPRLRVLLWHFLPQGVAWILSLVYLATSLAGSTLFPTLREIMGICTDASLIHLMAYVVFALSAARTGGHRRAAAWLRAVAAVSGTVIALMVLYSATGWKPLEFVAMALIALAVVAQFTLAQIRPQSLERFGQEARRKTYQRSTLDGVDTDLLQLRLQDLMEKEKVFLDELLSLDSLAERLGIPRNRLSEFLNGVLHTGFNAYVNQYRVAEVQRLLREQPQRSILSHAFSAGFNSKSVFYEAFRKLTGMTPQEYRDGAVSRST